MTSNTHLKVCGLGGLRTQCCCRRMLLPERQRVMLGLAACLYRSGDASEPGYMWKAEQQLSRWSRWLLQLAVSLPMSAELIRDAVVHMYMQTS